jgi:hypothetical protein
VTKYLFLKNSNISTNNPISRVEVAKVRGHLLGFLGFGTSDVCVLGLFCGKQKKEKKKKPEGG